MYARLGVVCHVLEAGSCLSCMKDWDSFLIWQSFHSTNCVMVQCLPGFFVLSGLLFSYIFLKRLFFTAFIPSRARRRCILETRSINYWRSGL